ncbi:hypothetical protein FJ527_28255 [Mesorhizobium sp. B2-4-18]|uniref:hypothetical protein n=1 Tax=Mesorhizobium sp. B2-4-18 TaxID=2589931 RepID=UPI00112D59C5|nr:hypothetical protein [Mesorhizobium sp. B2-4-18]TPK70770.1 hypothetical protein FJ527_28255 [Mesorhizobium sp. B2-4-18]
MPARRIVATAIFFVLSGVAQADPWWLESPPPAVQENQQSPADAAKDQNPKDEISETLWERTVYDPVALSTVVIAVFTVVLGIGTALLVLDGRRHSRHTLRAYVGVDRLEFEIPSLKDVNFRGRRFRQAIGKFGYVNKDFITVKVRNYGQTPAQDVCVFAYWAAAPRFTRLPDDFFDRNNEDVIDTGDVRTTLARFTLNPQSMEFSKTALTELVPIQAALKEHRFDIYVFGRVHYRDIYDRKWRTRFCYVWEPRHGPSGRFVAYEQYNGEDRRKLRGEAEAFPPNRYS